ncbi:flagellar protein FlaG ['Paenibacillus yunnanensis' Narsing Rao et al. 2020]|uniref:flagellar protein FlaG n=1 Tax=Paenibacillus tengchongensis TaxID=2608684 RepID=UPI00124EAE6C|nr:flagellar protein FlaG [Paenibacillus tengchongensis]
MDIRSTVSSSSYVNRTADVRPEFKEPAVENTASSNTEAPRSGEELKKMEQQGISVTTADEQVVKALDRALKALQGPTTTFEVSMHKETKTIMVKVLNKETGELIREVPPEKTLDLVANLMEAAGIIIDERV